METAYIIKGYRTAVGKAPRGVLRFKRPDEMAAETIKYLLKQVPELDNSQVDDVIVGNAMPEAEQGLNMGRFISLMALDRVEVSGMIVNRFCSSGIEAIAIATAKIQSGMADCIIAGGAESMSYVPMSGFKPAPSYKLAKEGHADYYWGMGLTAEEVAKRYDISREDQDEFSYNSHQKAIKAQAENRFKEQIAPIDVEHIFVNEEGKKETKNYTVTRDEGPRKDTSLEILAKLRPVFAQGGSVTAGNSSQMSDGAAFVVVMSEKMMKKLNLEPEARLKGYSTVGVEPKVMGIGPAFAVPKVLKQTGLSLNDIELVELNEAFASQSVAVIRELEMNPEIVNVNGGAIALGHPLGCTGAKLSVQIFDEMRKRKLNGKNALVTMCVGTGQGAAGVYEVY